MPDPAAATVDPIIESRLQRGVFERAVRTLVACEWERIELGVVSQRFVVPRWVSDGPDLLAGVVAMMTDSTLGSATMSTLVPGQMPVTVSLRLEMTGSGPPAGHEVRATAREVVGGASLRAATGEFTTMDGRTIAIATIRTLIVPVTDSRRPPGPPSTTPHHEPVVNEPGWLRLLTEPRPRFDLAAEGDLANSNSIMHGGISPLLVERAVHAAVTETTDATPNLSSLSVDYLAPVHCDGSRLSIDGDVLEAGRSLAHGVGRLRGPTQDTSVLVHATYRLAPTP